MSDLNLNPHAAASNEADRAVAVPAADLAALAESSRKGRGLRSARRRFTATRLVSTDDGFRPFRVY